MTLPWLAVIDMENVFAAPESPWFTPRFADVIAPIQRLVDAFRPRVTFTRFIAPETPEGAWRKYYERWPFALQPPDSPIYRIVPAFAQEAGTTLNRTTFSKWTPGLSHGGPLVLAGVATDCCVLCTALDAADAGTEVFVVADACAGSTDENQKRALDILGLYSPLIEVVTASGLLSSPMLLERAQK